jgi:hypothetical protein
MSFGISGCHNSGKTTLAKGLSEALGMHLYLTDTTAVAKSIGIDPVAKLSDENRFALQEYLLEHFWETSQKLPRPFVCDRTPLDYVAYTLSTLSHMHGDEQMGKRIATYIDRALWVTTNTFMSIIIVRELDGYEADPKRPPANVAYQRQTQLLIEGLAFGSLRHINRFIMPLSDHTRRMAEIGNHIADCVEESLKAKPILH